MTMGMPAIVIVPGFWCSATGIYEKLISTLQERGLDVVPSEYRSTGHGSSDGITMGDDINAVRSYIEPLVSKGREVVVAGHSAGGFIGGAAFVSLTRKSRIEAGQPGGVIGFAFICAAIFPLGQPVGILPFFDYQGEHLLCKDPLWGLFNDLDDNDARFWNERMRPQPAANWDAKIPYTGYEEVKCHYLICEQDQLLPKSLQEHVAAVVRAEITRCDAGHMVMLSQVDTLFDFFVKVVNDVSTSSSV